MTTSRQPTPDPARPALGLRVLHTGLILWLAVMLAGLLWTPKRIWLFEYHGLPGNVPMLGLAAGTLVVLITGTYRLRILCNVLLTLVLTGVYWLTSVQPLGDPEFIFAAMREGTVDLSELLSTVLYEVVRYAAGREAVPWVSPACGFLTVFFLLSLCDKLFLPKDSEHRNLIKKFCCLSVLASSWHVLFLRGYIETTQPSIPLLLIAIAYLSDYRHGKSANHMTRGFVFGCVFFTLAALTHWQILALFPALALVALFGGSPAFPLSKKVGVLVLGHVFAILTIGVVFAVMAWGPWRADPGLFGREGLTLLLPWKPGQAVMELEHLRLVACIVLFASPLSLFLPALLTSSAGERCRALAAQRHPTLLIFGLGFCGFASFVYFEHGFPGHWDLMLSMGVLLHLFLLPIFLEFVTGSAARRRTGAIVLVVGAVMSWTLMSSVTIPPPAPHPLGTGWEGDVKAANGATEPLLFVNGRTGVVHMRRSEPVVLEVRLPRGHFGPARIAVVSAPGIPEDVTGPEIVPTDPRGVLILANSLNPKPGADTSDQSAPWIHVTRGTAAPGTVQTVQAKIELGPGNVRTTNAVVIRW